MVLGKFCDCGAYLGSGACHGYCASCALENRREYAHQRTQDKSARAKERRKRECPHCRRRIAQHLMHQHMAEVHGEKK